MSISVVETTLVPVVNDLVFVRVADHDSQHDFPPRENSSRVEDIVADDASGDIKEYVIAAPLIAAPPTGSPLHLLWLIPRGGVGVLPVAFAQETRTQNDLRLWRVTVTGTPHREQRRRYVRIALSLPTELKVRCERDTLNDAAGRAVTPPWVSPVGEELPDAISCVATNVSEGGMRLNSMDHVFPSGAAVTCAFTMADQAFLFDARVVWSTGSRAKGRTVVESAVEFENGGKQADSLRRLVFQAQLLERHLNA